jgi:hypothetical protein
VLSSARLSCRRAGTGHEQQAEHALNEVEDARNAMPGGEAVPQHALHHFARQGVGLELRQQRLQSEQTDRGEHSINSSSQKFQRRMTALPLRSNRNNNR